MKKLYSVQYLRAIAAILVVYCHAIDLRVRFGLSFQQTFLHLDNFGAIGVDIFFVISGFIIALIAGGEGGISRSSEFFKRRFLRVAPVYYIASFIYFCLFILFFDASLAPVLKTLTILPIADSGHVFVEPVLQIGWTLSFEFLFYILYGLLIAFAVRKREAALLLLVTIIYLAGYLFPNGNIQWLFFTNPMILEFGMGVLIAMACKSQKALPRYLPYLCLFTGVVLYGYLIITGYGNVSEAELLMQSNTLALERVVLWGIPSAFLVAGFIFRERERPVVKKRTLLLFLGNASYSIYLAHPICFKALGSLLRRFPVLNTIPGDMLIFIFVGTGILSGALFYLFVEKPLLKRLGLRQT